MLSYYLELALRSLKRSKVLTALMILSIGLGIGASMTMLTVLHVMSGDPLPGRSGQLYAPQLDPRPLEQLNTGLVASSGAPDSLTWVDAINLLQADRADRQAAMAGGSLAVRPMLGTLHPFFQSGRYVTADFFPMFGVPFRSGSGWTAQQDERRARVVVLNADLNHKLFGNVPSVGRIVQLKNADFRVIGVLDDWHPQPTFYAQPGHGVFGEPDQFFLPLQTAIDLKYSFSGNFSCWGNDESGRTSDHCTWVQFWVQLDSASKVAAYRIFLTNYWRDQQTHGRFPRPVNTQLSGLMQWLAQRQLVPGDLRLQLWLALSFLGVCMVNIVGLLLAKFLRRGGEVSVRRAMGARRSDIFMQLGIESAMIGMAGGVLGLAVAEVGLWSVRQRPDGYAQLAQMDAFMLFATFALAVCASVLAGLLPAWRACCISPALQLKAQ